MNGMDKFKWLIDQGYKHDESTDHYYFQIRIFEYGAQIGFTGWELLDLNLESVQARHNEFIKRALNREQF